ncbi:hypothetical protein [Actinophytocola sp.]|uniref:hypothetical protein n=1 Tax=Actinophytocola sp. TaxID=1872138 RepID=UPI003D6B247C
MLALDVDDGDIPLVDPLAVTRSVARDHHRRRITVRNTTSGQAFATRHRLSDRQVAMLLAGGLILATPPEAHVHGGHAATTTPSSFRMSRTASRAGRG